MDINDQKPTNCKLMNYKNILIVFGISMCLFLAGIIYFIIKCYNQNQFIYFNHRLYTNDLLNYNYKTNSSTIEVQDTEYIIRLAVPGFTKEQIKIELNNNILIIYGKNFDQEGESKFEQVISLNNDIERDSIRSSLKDGILIINIARNRQKVEPKTINIE